MSLALEIGDPSSEDLCDLISPFAAQPRYGLLPPPGAEVGPLLRAQEFVSEHINLGPPATRSRYGTNLNLI